MSTDIFNKRWYGIQGFGTGTMPTLAVRVKTSKSGPWQSLKEDECKRLVDLHNKYFGAEQEVNKSIQMIRNAAKDASERGKKK